MLVKTEQYNIRVYSSTKLTPIQVSLKGNERFAYNILLDKRKKIKPKCKIHHLVRTADLLRIFSKRHSTTWSFELHEFTEITNVTILSYHIDNLAERHKEALLKMTELSMKEDKDVVKP